MTARRASAARRCGLPACGHTLGTVVIKVSSDGGRNSRDDGAVAAVAEQSAHWHAFILARQLWDQQDQQATHPQDGGEARGERHYIYPTEMYARTQPASRMDAPARWPSGRTAAPWRTLAHPHVTPGPEGGWAGWAGLGHRPAARATRTARSASNESAWGGAGPPNHSPFIPAALAAAAGSPSPSCTERH